MLVLFVSSVSLLLLLPLLVVFHFLSSTLRHHRQCTPARVNVVPYASMSSLLLVCRNRSPATAFLSSSSSSSALLLGRSWISRGVTVGRPLHTLRRLSLLPAAPSLPRTTRGHSGSIRQEPASAWLSTTHGRYFHTKDSGVEYTSASARTTTTATATSTEPSPPTKPKPSLSEAQRLFSLARPEARRLGVWLSNDAHTRAHENQWNGRAGSRSIDGEYKSG
ncbi:hypothetical protein SYNPS1DRAFT_31419 [Syncephalis pseudoplumigaleata]|uniref:Uncharacterized protein n=1 Tax=Syncephalis pseudoplumigaleata TaxID=1712513 RepID=A0A4P9YT76_9FUNG|nr:hypothetical protein SYNPS1DRAFT_31419 [Syncephalis pseudoplumigaleata]|eukprot:RKP22908.1 hypothetical protein SYNPS1DRAFT_31419 [Syncephalis pseudoplumigaleata]